MINFLVVIAFIISSLAVNFKVSAFAPLARLVVSSRAIPRTDCPASLCKLTKDETSLEQQARSAVASASLLGVLLLTTSSFAIETSTSPSLPAIAGNVPASAYSKVVKKEEVKSPSKKTAASTVSSKASAVAPLTTIKKVVQPPEKLALDKAKADLVYARNNLLEAQRKVTAAKKAFSLADVSEKSAAKTYDIAKQKANSSPNNENKTTLNNVNLNFQKAAKTRKEAEAALKSSKSNLSKLESLKDNAEKNVKKAEKKYSEYNAKKLRQEKEAKERAKKDAERMAKEKEAQREKARKELSKKMEDASRKIKELEKSSKSTTDKKIKASNSEKIKALQKQKQELEILQKKL